MVNDSEVRQLAGESNDRETAIIETRRQVINGCTRGAEHQCIRRFIVAKNVDDRIFAVAAGNRVTTRLQSGYLYSYALVMLLGLIGAASWAIWWAQ